MPEALRDLGSVLIPSGIHGCSTLSKCLCLSGSQLHLYKMKKLTLWPEGGRWQAGSLVTGYTLQILPDSEAGQHEEWSGGGSALVGLTNNSPSCFWNAYY